MTWQTHFLHKHPHEKSCTFTTTLHVKWLTHFLHKHPNEKSYTFTTTLHVTWLTHFLHKHPHDKSCTFTTTLHVKWLTHFLHKHPNEKSYTFTTTLHVTWLPHFLHTRKILFIYYNITCDMADTFSAQTSTSTLQIIKCPVSVSFEVSFTFTTALHVTWLTHFLHNLPHEKSCTFTTTFHVTWLPHFLHTRKILFIYYNITCDMADTFSAQTST